MRIQDIDIGADLRVSVKALKDILITEQLINSSFHMVEITFAGSGTFLVAHGLGFKPTDVIQTRLTGAGALTWNYANFDYTNLSITTTGACTVRAFVGAYRN